MLSNASNPSAVPDLAGNALYADKVLLALHSILLGTVMCIGMIRWPVTCNKQFLKLVNYVTTSASTVSS